MRTKTPTPPLHVVEILEATGGGTRTHLLQLLEGLDRGQFRLTLIAAAERERRFRRDIADLRGRGIDVIEIPMVRPIAPFRDTQSLVRLCDVLDRLRPDVVHTHASKAGALGRIAAQLCGIRAVVHTPHVYYFQGKHGRSRQFYRLIERIMWPLAARSVALCAGQGRLARQELSIPASRLAVIENGIDPAYFRPRRARAEARASLGLPAGSPVIGTVSRFVPQKGNDVFLRAVSHVLRRMPACRCLFVAEGPLRDRMIALAESLAVADRILWHDYVADPREIYEALDVFILSSRYEGLPYALLEALSMAVPAVVTDIAGCREIVTAGQAGLIVPPDNPPALAEAVFALLRDPDKAREMGRRGREIVAREYSAARFLQRIGTLYRQLARR